MAAPVRVDVDAFGDPRIEMLASLAGYNRYEALGRLVYLWSYCTDRQLYVVAANVIEGMLGTPAETLVRAGLADEGIDGLRVRGTMGRIEWLGARRAAGKIGGKQTASKREANAKQTDSNGQANPEQEPSKAKLLSLSLSLSPVKEDLRNPVVPKKPRGRPKKLKPSEPTEAEQASVRAVLEKLTARNGVRYSGTATHTALIVARLRDGFSEMDLRKVIAFCAEDLGWQSDPKMASFLRPETLFGPMTISRYVDAARAWYEQAHPTNGANGASE